MKTIFISYRREDSSGHSGRLYDKLAESYGSPNVFMDIDGIGPGQNFQQVLNSAIKSSGVVLAVIGRNWAGSSPGRRRIDEASDFVRMEIAASLKRGVRLIPVLVNGASVPKANELPSDIAILSSLHAVEISDSRWSHDLRTLTSAIDLELGVSRPSLSIQKDSNASGCGKVILLLFAIACSLLSLLWTILTFAKGSDQVAFGIMAAFGGLGAIAAWRKLISN